MKFPSYLLLTFLAIALSSPIFGKSHTFFTPRQITTNSMFELALTNYSMYHSDNPELCQFYVKPFYQQSTNKKKAAQYFLPGNKECVTVREDGTGDIDPLWFNVISASGTYYSSELDFRPERSVYGSVLTFFAKLPCEWWLLFNTAVIGTKHNLHVHETESENLGTIPDFTNLCQAFNDPAWTAGKIACGANAHKTGLDDIQVKIGNNLWHTNYSHLALYGVVTAPTGKEPKSNYLFEPLVGSKHASVGAGLNMDYVVDARETTQWTILADVKYRYAFKGTERRSFDLCGNGDWSRYLLVVTPEEPLFTLPGINYFTMPVSVTPRSTVEAFLAFHYEWCHCHFEVGYNLWWRQQEHIKLQCDSGFCSTIGIFDLTGPCSSNPTTASNSHINSAITNNRAASDPSFTPVTLRDLNLASAAHPEAASNTIYLATVWRNYHPQRPLMIGLGGSYEFANRNALNQWSVWLMMEVDFSLGQQINEQW